VIINENQLDEWVRSNSREAQGVIVSLVRRLVAASCPKATAFRFPDGDSIGQHGPDGTLNVELPYDPYIPAGGSFWEIGTGLDAGDKATSDFNGLVTEIPTPTRLNSTFIFVTPLSGRRGWQYTWKEGQQEAWREERLAAGEWKDVRIIDGTILIDWVHHFPPIELWLAQQMTGKSIQRIESLEQHWENIRSRGEYPIPPTLFLIGRDDACAKVKEILDGTALQLKVETHFPDQVVDFVAACFANLDAEARTKVEGRCLVISGITEWEEISSLRDRMIFVAGPELDIGSESASKLLQQARSNGHAVIFGGSAGGVPDPSSVPLRAIHPHQIQKALEEAGYGEERARALSQRSGGNVSSLLRLLQNLSLTPDWAVGAAATDLAIAAMLGSWTDSSAADRAVPETLSKKPYAEWIRQIREVSHQPGAPITQRDDKWRFTARFESWYALGPRIYNEDLVRLQQAAINVLSEKDPQFDLEKDQRWIANIYGKILTHSNLLRNGLAESLALLGCHPDALCSCTSGNPERTADLAVRGILADADWIRWASINDLLPYLAEAAPGEFLDAVEKALGASPCPFDLLFAQEGDGIFGRTYVSGLLWALETLAWSSDLLHRVVICLGELAARDPGGQIANRPLNSLTTIFLSWLPQTCAPLEKRISAIRGLLDEVPEVGWKLLMSLLPQWHSTTSGTRRPAWREFIPADWPMRLTYGEVREQIELNSQAAFAAAQGNVQRLVELMGHIENLPLSVQDQLIGYLESEPVQQWPEDDKVKLWNPLIDAIAKHKKYPTAKWAMKPERIEIFSSLADQLAPKSPSFRHQRLFRGRDHDLFEGNEDYEEQMAKLNARRQRAVAEIASGGIPQVLAFSALVQSPGQVGVAFGFTAGMEADQFVIPDLLESEQQYLIRFAAGYVWGRFRSKGWSWVDSVDTTRWPPSQIGRFLSFLPFDPGTWERSARLLGSNEEPYWSKASANPYESQSGFEPAVDQLIRYGRPLAALICLHKMFLDRGQIDRERAVRALLAPRGSDKGLDPPDAHEIVEIIKALQQDPATNPDELSRIEWIYLALLDHSTGAAPITLSRRMAEDPAFFCDFIRMRFPIKKEELSSEEERKKYTEIVTNIHHLFNEWRLPPGSLTEGAFDGDALVRWLEAVKKELAGSDTLGKAMTILGHALKYAPADPDGLWIHRSVASVLNAKEAEDIRSGFRNELYNSPHEMHWVDPTGAREKELAAKYRGQAEAVENAGYTRLATMLRDLAGEYDKEAGRTASRDLLED